MRKNSVLPVIGGCPLRLNALQAIFGVRGYIFYQPKKSKKSAELIFFTCSRRNVPQFFLPTFGEVFVRNRSQGVVRFVVVQSVHCVYKQNENRRAAAQKFIDIPLLGIRLAPG